MCRTLFFLLLLPFSLGPLAKAETVDARQAFVTRYCADCHSGEAPAASFDVTRLSTRWDDAENVRLWVKVYDQVHSQQMPPPDEVTAESDLPAATQRNDYLQSLKQALIAADEAAKLREPKIRRLTRGEYENTIRDLFELPGLALADQLPADGSMHGFDKHIDALDLSHVNIAKYLETAEQVLDFAIATRPQPPTVQQRRISLVNRGGFVAHVVMNGDGVLLKDKKPDPRFPPAAKQNHFDEGAHERWGSFRTDAAVGLFRHEDESLNPYFIEHVTIYPGVYRVRTSLWSFQWDKGAVLPSRGTEAARLSVVQLTGDGRGGQHPSYVLGYFDAPNTNAKEHELHVWLNPNELIGFNTASLAPVANYSRPGRAMAFTGPGIAVDWLDIEGPLHSIWPPRSHQRLFGDLPLNEFSQDQQSGVRAPVRKQVRQLGAAMNRADNEPGIWTVTSDNALVDADRLLANFLPRLFRRPVDEALRKSYVEVVRQRLDSGDCFEMAMRAAYRDALCSPQFLFHLTPTGKRDAAALACQLSYFLWNSIPDEKLRSLAETGQLLQPQTWHQQVKRMLDDPRSHRFTNDFVGQWLKLRQIASTDPDKDLYPEFGPYLQDSMVAETRAYLRRLIDTDADATHLVQSPFVMINEKLAKHYGIDGVTGSGIRQVPLPDHCPRGGFLTQASILKLTANGTTTSPVPRGAFVMDRLLGETPEPPPANVPAIEPDVQGTTTIRQQLEKHREDKQCAFCHDRIDPPGFALEAFDAIGGFRDRYRSVGTGDEAPRGSIDPFIPIGFRLGLPVSTAGQLSSGQSFADIKEYQALLAQDPERLLRGIAHSLVIYATGRQAGFADRDELNRIIERTQASGGGLRTMIHELVSSSLFTGQDRIELPAGFEVKSDQPSTDATDRLMMTELPAAVNDPIRVTPSPSIDQVQPSYTFDAAHQIKLQAIGLFAARQADALKVVLSKIPELKWVDADFDNGTVTIAYAHDSGVYKGADAAQITARIDQQLRQQSDRILGVRNLPAIERSQLQRHDLPIAGLHCDACSLGCYEMLIQIPGVVDAMADFTHGQVTVWIDPLTTDLEKIKSAVTQRGLTWDE